MQKCYTLWGVILWRYINYLPVLVNGKLYERDTKMNVLKTDIKLIGELFESPRVLALAIGLPGLIGSLLRWRGSSVRLLSVLVGLLGGETDARVKRESRVSVELSNAMLSAMLWPDAGSTDSAKNKCTRWLRAFAEDQSLSKALLIHRERGGRIERKNGKLEFYSSRYMVRDFDYLASAIGTRLAMLSEWNHVAVRQLVGSALLDFGCVPILPEMRAEEKERLKIGEDKAKTRKQIERAKRGEIEMEFQEILALSRPDRIEVLCGQFLRWGDLLLDEIQDYEDVEQLKWIAEGMQKKFGAAVAQTLERRYAAERSKLINRSGLKVA